MIRTGKQQGSLLLSRDLAAFTLWHVGNVFKVAFFGGMCSDFNVKRVFALMRVERCPASIRLFWYVCEHWLDLY